MIPPPGDVARLLVPEDMSPVMPERPGTCSGFDVRCRGAANVSSRAAVGGMFRPRPCGNGTASDPSLEVCSPAEFDRGMRVVGLGPALALVPETPVSIRLIVRGEMAASAESDPKTGRASGSCMLVRNLCDCLVVGKSGDKALDRDEVDPDAGKSEGNDGRGRCICR